MAGISFDPYTPDPTPGTDGSGPAGLSGSANASAPSFAATLAAIGRGSVVGPPAAAAFRPLPAGPSPAAGVSDPAPAGSFQPLSFAAMIQQRAARVNVDAWLGKTLPSWGQAGAPQSNSGAPAGALAPLGDAAEAAASGAGPAATSPSATVSSIAPAAAPPAMPAAGADPIAPSSTAMPLSAYPRPPGDNGRGIHWVPTLYSTPAVVDQYVDQAVKMGVHWVTFLNDGTNLKDNEYLVKKLVANGIEPIMRVYTAPGQTIQGDLQGLVRHYSALGVHYYQLYNEPNLNAENAGQAPSVDRYLDEWIPAARAVEAAGGLPGFGSLSPGGNYDDLAFFRQALQGIKQRGQADVLDKAWISAHNYTLNHPLDYTKDSNGFLKFRWYDQIARQELGRSLPIISTEGGTFVGDQQDTTMPAVDEQSQVQMVVDQFRYMEQPHEPYYFAATYWVIANQAGGGHDLGFERQALFQPGHVSPVVAALDQLA